MDLSPFHFCRAFKKSFGVPPHRYHTGRRIERAKAMLAKQALSVTEIGLAVGFSETSSLSAASRKQQVASSQLPDEFRLMEPALHVLMFVHFAIRKRKTASGGSEKRQGSSFLPL